MKCSMQLVSQCFGDFVASCVVCLLNISATDNFVLAKITEILASFRLEDEDEDKDENEDQGQLLLIVRILKSVTVMA